MKTQILLFITVLMVESISAQEMPDLKTLIFKDETITARAETETCWWIGTTRGVYRIKKKNMKPVHYTMRNSDLPSDLITAICTMPDGQVYIGTHRGILRYDRFAFMIINTENSKLPSDDIRSLRCDTQKGIVAETDSTFIPRAKMNFKLYKN